MDIPDREKVDPAAAEGRPSRWSRVRRGVRGPFPHPARCGSPRFFGFPMRKQEGDRRGSNPRPSEPQADAAHCRLSSFVLLFDLYMEVSVISGHTFVRPLLACTSSVAVRLRYDA